MGCSSLFLQSDNTTSPTPVNFHYQDIYTMSGDHELHGWLVKTDEEKKGTVLYIHGNRDNVSSQTCRVHWLNDFGYDIVTFDFKGFGSSEGRASVPGAIDDIKHMFDWVIANTRTDEKIYIFAQSIGGTMAITALADYPLKQRFSKIIVDSAFSSFREIAQEFAKKNIFTSIFVPLAHAVISDRYSAISHIDKIAPVPLVIMHGDEDHVINVSHAGKLFDRAREPKTLWILKGYDHIQALQAPKNRLKFVSLLEST